MNSNNLERFKTTWTNILFPPASLIDIGLDAALWILSASTLTGLGQILPLLLLPLFAWVVAVSFAIWYIPAVRLAAVYRFALIVLGIFILL